MYYLVTVPDPALGERPTVREFATYEECDRAWDDIKDRLRCTQSYTFAFIGHQMMDTTAKEESARQKWAGGPWQTKVIQKARINRTGLVPQTYLTETADFAPPSPDEAPSGPPSLAQAAMPMPKALAAIPDPEEKE
jgi:hypothetical protein